MFQIILIGLIGSILGTGLGVTLQQLFPILLQDFLPVNVQFSINYNVIGLGLLLGVMMSIVFSLYPLISTWFVTPNEVLRAQVKTNYKIRVLAFIVGPVIAITVFLFFIFAFRTIALFHHFLGWNFSCFGLIRLMAGLFIKLVQNLFPKNGVFLLDKVFQFVPTRTKPSL